MRVILRGQRVTLDDGLLLGQGGEARVYRHPSEALALKVYTAPDRDAPKAEHAQHRALMALRERKLAALPPALPSAVVRPHSVLHDDGGTFIGYAMETVPHPLEMGTLSRADRALHANDVMRVFRELLATLERVHASRCVVGDFNDGNVLLQDAQAPRLIDVDSWQIEGLPCPVAHERFLDPQLYGVELAAHCAFNPGTDLYALRVMLFQSLLFVHPYGGIHPAHKTLLRRAEARHSVLRGDVQLPKRALPPHTLPDAMLEDFARAFDGNERRPLALPDTAFVTCSCGMVHARSACPACRVVVHKPVKRVHGNVVAETVVETRGAVLAAGVVGGRLWSLVDDGACVRREDRAVVWPRRREADQQFAVEGERTWVARHGRLVCVQHEREVDHALADVWCVGTDGLHLLEGDALVHHKTRRRVGRVLAGGTRLFASGSGGLALYRAGNTLRGFWFGQGAPVDLAPMPAVGRIVDVAVTFGDGRALIGLAYDERGVRLHALTLVDAKGVQLARAVGRPDEAPLLGTIRGFCLAHGKLLAPTSEGVLAFEAAGGALQERARFVGTEAFVDATSELLLAPGGELFVVDARCIVKLRMGRSS